MLAYCGNQIYEFTCSKYKYYINLLENMHTIFFSINCFNML